VGIKVDAHPKYCCEEDSASRPYQNRNSQSLPGFLLLHLNLCNCNTFFQLVCKHSRGSSGNPTDNTVVQLERIQTFIQDLTQITNEIRRQEAEQREKEKAKNRE
jgi:hypothetical protein